MRPVTGLTPSANLGQLNTRLDSFLPDLGWGQANSGGNRPPLAPHVTFTGMAD
jgi:hypothetical protein